jgi:hypothetical protein
MVTFETKVALVTLGRSFAHHRPSHCRRWRVGRSVSLA